MSIKEIDFDKYKKHPRVLEVRFVLLFNLIEREYGYNQSIKMFQALCNTFNCNITFLQGIVNNRYNIQKGKRNYIMWRQEIIFAATCYGESMYKVANEYINVLPSTMYSQPDKYNLERFCNDEWLRKLDDRVTLCGQLAYKNEVIRFFEVIDMFADVLARWKGGK